MIGESTCDQLFFEVCAYTWLYVRSTRVLPHAGHFGVVLDSDIGRTTSNDFWQ